MPDELQGQKRKRKWTKRGKREDGGGGWGLGVWAGGGGWGGWGVWWGAENNIWSVLVVIVLVVDVSVVGSRDTPRKGELQFSWDSLTA